MRFTKEQAELAHNLYIDSHKQGYKSHIGRANWKARKLEAHNKPLREQLEIERAKLRKFKAASVKTEVMRRQLAVISTLSDRILELSDLPAASKQWSQDSHG